ncbi:MAG: hypothetical protein H6581_05050 [Bacteroidia bacterium]|nr:hypothetical protein [Bacteroidia bacterium]
MLLEKEIKELRKMLPFADRQKPSVSAVGIDWQIDHSCRVILSIIKAITTSDPATYKWQFRIWRIILLPMGWFPRGRARAPRAVTAKEEITNENLLSLLDAVEQKLGQLDDLDPKSYFMHPYFGPMNLKNTQKFLRLHTRHHLKIMYDILK